MKKYLTDAEIRKIFSNPHSLNKGMKLWKYAEKRGEKFVRGIIERRKKEIQK